MRLRQAHAILEAQQTLLAMSDLGFETWPIDHDSADLAQHTPDDYLTGYAEFNDPDNPTGNTRTYNLDIRPGPGDLYITACLRFSYAWGAPLLDATFQVHTPQDDESKPFDEGVGAMVARVVADAVRAHEKPFEAAYVARAGRPPEER